MLIYFYLKLLKIKFYINKFTSIWRRNQYAIAKVEKFTNLLLFEKSMKREYENVSTWPFAYPIWFPLIFIAKLRINIDWITSSHGTCLVKVERNHLSVMQEISYFVERLKDKIDMHGIFRARLIENDLSEMKEFVSKIQDTIIFSIFNI